MVKNRTEGVRYLVLRVYTVMEAAWLSVFAVQERSHTVSKHFVEKNGKSCRRYRLSLIHI